MRYFFGCVAFLFVIAGCSTTEPVQQEEETGSPEPVVSETAIPSWYNAGTHSASDSLALHGYALASAVDSARAVDLSTQTALEYLRFEIDRAAEDVRENLTNSSSTGDHYSSSEFIIRLRNTISDLQLNAAEVTLHHESNDQGVHYSYAKASVSQSELRVLFESQLNDEAFLDKIGSVSR